MPSVNTHAIFVAPFFLETTLRFVAGAVNLPGVRLSLVSQDPAERLPPRLRGSLAAHWRVDDALDPNQLTQAAEALSKQLGAPQRMIGALEQLQVPLAEARAALGIEGLSPEAARNFRDKSQMKDVLAAAGVPCARHLLAESAAEAIAFAEKVGFPLVAKPPAGAGGKRTFRINSGDELRTMLQRYPPSRIDSTLLEEFVSGEEHSFDAVMIQGRPLWYSISRYMPSPLEVLENPWIQWCVFLPRNVSGGEYGAIRDAGFNALHALGMKTGLAHMEWFRLKGGRIAISEVGARPPGAQFTSLLSWAHDVDFYRAWPRLMIFDDFDPPQRRYAAGAAYFRGQGPDRSPGQGPDRSPGQGPSRIKVIHGLDEAQKRYGYMVVESRLPRAGQAPSDSYEGDGFVILRHPNSDLVEDALKNIVRLVRVELR